MNHMLDLLWVLGEHFDSMFQRDEVGRSESSLSSTRGQAPGDKGISERFKERLFKYSV